MGAGPGALGRRSLDPEDRARRARHRPGRRGPADTDSLTPTSPTPTGPTPTGSTPRCRGSATACTAGSAGSPRCWPRSGSPGPGPREERALADGDRRPRSARAIADQTDCTYFDGLVSTIGRSPRWMRRRRRRRSPGSRRSRRPTAGPRRSSVGPRLPPGRPRSTTSPSARRACCSVRCGRGGRARRGRGRWPSTPAACCWPRPSTRRPAPTGVRAAALRAGRPAIEMPNLSHGLAGIAAALAVAGAELDRPGPGRGGPQRRRAPGLARGPHRRRASSSRATCPRDLDDQDEVTYTWCHGATGTSLLFLALDRRRRRGGRATRRSPGTAGACTACGRRGCPRGSTPASGTTTDAAAVRRAWATCSWTPGSAGRRRGPRVRAAAGRRPGRARGARRGRTPTGGSSSTAPPSRCCHPAWAGCRGRPASRRSCSGRAACCSRAAARRRSSGWTAGGPCPTAPTIRRTTARHATTDDQGGRTTSAGRPGERTTRRPNRRAPRPPDEQRARRAAGPMTTRPADPTAKPPGGPESDHQAPRPPTDQAGWTA